jgi:hypothetical protein
VCPTVMSSAQVLNDVGAARELGGDEVKVLHLSALPFLVSICAQVAAGDSHRCALLQPKTWRDREDVGGVSLYCLQ